MIDIEFVRSRFIKHFDGKTGNVYTSPGRINLIGEHTDYNGGFVFPGAVDKGITAEMRVNGTEDTVMAYAIDLKDRVDFHLNDPAGPKASWARYIYGIAKEFQKLGVPVKGFNIAFAGDVPLGAGILTKFEPRKLLTACLCIGAGCIALSLVFSSSMVGIWLMLAAGLFHSVMWPLIFNLGLQELGPHTKAASGVINTGVIGGALLMPVMGAMVDGMGIITAMCLMFVFYAYIIWFCNFGSKIGISAK